VTRIHQQHPPKSTRAFCQVEAVLSIDSRGQAGPRDYERMSGVRAGNSEQLPGETLKKSTDIKKVAEHIFNLPERLQKVLMNGISEQASRLR